PRYDMINFTNTLYDNVLRMVQRDHAVVDISKSDDISYTIHYENTIPWLPIQTDEVGTVTGGSF
nr:VP4 [Opsiphanes invirae iflavirus 1]